MNRIVLSTLVLIASVAPAFAVPVIAVPEPVTMSLFGLGVGGVYIVKRFKGRK